MKINQLLTAIFLFYSIYSMSQTSGVEAHGGIKLFQPKLILNTENPDVAIESKAVPTFGVSYVHLIAKDISAIYSFDFTGFKTNFTEPSSLNEFVDPFSPDQSTVNTFELKSGIALNVRVIGFYEILENFNVGVGFGTDRFTNLSVEQTLEASRLSNEIEPGKDLNINFIPAIYYTKDSFRVDVQYQFGLSNFNSDFENPELDAYEKIKINQFSLTIGYLFNQN